MKYLAIDIGGTNVKFGLLDAKGKILERAEIEVPLSKETSSSDFLDVVLKFVYPYEKQIEGVAISMPGIIDSESGYCLSAGAIHCLAEVNVVQLIKKHINLPVTVQNDGKCAVLAEHWIGNLRGYKNSAVVLLGTGIGGGLIINGELYNGHNFAAGEMSFMLFNASEKEFGFWAGKNSTTALVRKVSEKTDIPLSKLNGRKVFELIEEGNEFALTVLEEFCEDLASQLYSLQSLLDLEMFAIGGGISKQPKLMEILQKKIDYYNDNHPMESYMSFIPKPKVITCKFYNDSNLIGAVYHHLKLTSKHTKIKDM